MKIILKTSVVAILFMFQSCSAFVYPNKKEKAIFDSYINETKATLIERFGAPTRVLSDGKNGEIVIYENTQFVSGQPCILYKDMYVNSQGIIYKWKAGWR